MRIVIVEDEPPAAMRLERALEQYDIEVVARLQTVTETSNWFATHPEPDLVFLDVHLSDGLSLDVFRRAAITCPVIFTTAYDAYALDAFECNSIDYLLKPIRPERLALAMNRYDKLRTHFTSDVVDVLQNAISSNKPEYKRRLLVQRGTSYLALDEQNLCYAFSDQKTTFLVDAEGQRFLFSDALTTLEKALNPADFFRINRKYLARIDAVRSFKPVGRGRLRVELSPPPGEKIHVSQEKAARFRTWIEQ